MRTSTTTSFDLFSGDLRMDASFHASSGQYSTRILKNSNLHTDRLDKVCIPGGIFIPGRFRRVYVDNPENGLKWLSPTDMQKADLSGLGFISRKYTSNLDNLRLHRGWILLSRSGTIGNLAYVRADMDGLIGSDDIIRIVADPKQILSGYLYAVICNPIILNLIQQKTYGAVIPHIEAHHVVELPIPRLNTTEEVRIHQLIEQSAQLRVEANRNLQQAQETLDTFIYSKNQQIKVPNRLTLNSPKLGTLHSDSIYLSDFRLDASYHASIGQKTLGELVKTGTKLMRLDQLCLPNGIFIPGRFKRIYVDDPQFGAPYLTGSSISKIKPQHGAKFLSSRQIENKDELILRDKMILITCSGIIGNSAYVNINFRGAVGSPDLIRILADSQKIKSGYLYAFIRSPLAKILIQQRTYGAVVPHIEAHHIFDLPVPRLEESKETFIHNLIEKASELQERAIEFEDQAQSLLNTSLGLPS